MHNADFMSVRIFLVSLSAHRPSLLFIHCQSTIIIVNSMEKKICVYCSYVEIAIYMYMSKERPT